MNPNDASRRIGKTSLVVPLMIALVICGAAIYWLVQNETEPNATDLKQNPVASKVGAKSSDSVVDDIEKPVVDTEDTLQKTEGSSPSKDWLKDPSTEISQLRIHGRVTDINGVALEGAAVRWIPLTPDDLRRFSHDRSVLGKDLMIENLPRGKVREALSRSVIVGADDSGKYEITSPPVEGPSVVAVSLAGYELIIREVSVEQNAEPSTKPSSTKANEENSVANNNRKVVEIQLDFQLRQAGSISGTVTESETGDPAKGMTVLAGKIEQGTPAFRATVKEDAPSAVVDSDGNYTIGGLIPGQYQLIARTGDTNWVSIPSTKARRVVLEAGTDVTGADLTVSRGGIIRGFVVDPDNKELSGVQCRILLKDAVSRASGGDTEAIQRSTVQFTNNEGTFEFRGLALNEECQVVSFKKGWAPVLSDAIKLTAKNPEAEIDIVLNEGWSVSGRVVDIQGMPIPEINVRALPLLELWLMGSELLRTVKSDENGRFHFDNLPTGEIRLLAGDKDPYQITAEEDQGVTTVNIKDADIRGVELIASVKQKDGDGTLSGIVVDDQGTPIPGATIRVSRTDDYLTKSAKTTKSNERGEFSVEGLSGSEFRVEGSKSEHSNGVLTNIQEGSWGLELTLKRFSWISGEVLVTEGDLTGAPGTVYSRLVGDEDLSESVKALATGGFKKHAKSKISKDGKFRLASPTGRVKVHARVAGFAPGSSNTIIVAPGEEYRGVRIRLTRGATIFGKVVTSTNVQVSGASVRATLHEDGGWKDAYRKMMPEFFDNAENRTVTQPTGDYQLDYLAPGEYTLVATHPDYAPSNPTVLKISTDERHGPTDLVLVVPARLTVRIRQGNKPKPGMLVQVIDHHMRIQQGMSNTKGIFTQNRLRPGGYRVQIMDLSGIQQGKYGIKLANVNVESGPNELEVVYGLGHSISGKIKGIPKGPVQQVVTLTRIPEDFDPKNPEATEGLETQQVGMGMVSPSGEYEVPDVPPGKYFLIVPKLPSDPTKPGAWTEAIRKPLYQTEIEMRDGDINHDFTIEGN